MEPWYFILGMFALAGLFWLASLSETMLRFFMVAWSIGLLVVGAGVVWGTVLGLTEVPWFLTVGAIKGLASVVVGGGLGLGALYAGYRGIGEAFRKWH